jgi:hypothetical protein
MHGGSQVTSKSGRLGGYTGAQDLCKAERYAQQSMQRAIACKKNIIVRRLLLALRYSDVSLLSHHVTKVLLQRITYFKGIF